MRTPFKVFKDFRVDQERDRSRRDRTHNMLSRGVFGQGCVRGEVFPGRTPSRDWCEVTTLKGNRARDLPGERRIRGGPYYV